MRGKALAVPAAILCLAAAAAGGQRREILNADSYFRLGLGWKTPVIVSVL